MTPFHDNGYRCSWFYIEGINPEPWTAPEFSTGRKNGKIFTQAYKNAGLAAYQEAIKESLLRNYPDVEGFTHQITLEFFLRRQIVQYKGESKAVTKSHSDNTNMQKALEDAIQGILIENDREVVDIRTVLVAEGTEIEPQIIIKVSTFPNTSRWLDEKAAHLRKHQQNRRHPLSAGRERTGAEDVF